MDEQSDGTAGRPIRRRPALALAFALALVLPLLAACGGSAGDEQPDFSQRPVKAVATIGQIADVVGVVGGEYVDVEALMGPGVDPHLYKASEADVATLGEADVVFYNGLHLEGKMGDVLEQLAEQRPVIAVTEDIPRDQLRETPAFQGNFDPHVWFDATLWAKAVDRVARALVELDPAHADAYEANAAAYRVELEKLDAYAMEQIASIPAERRVLVTAHDAFGYFGRRYGIEVVGLQGISTETEAGIDDVQRIAKLIADRKIKAMFVETSVSPRTIEAVQAAVRDMGGEVAIGGQLYSDAMGEAGTPEGTYLGMFRHNVDTVVAALR